MKPATGATPLIALDCVAIDTETTGLDTAEARIVEIAALRILRGEVRADDAFSTLVDPRVPIPSSATAIHGIGNAMVRQAPDFERALPAFERFCAGRVLIGYSVGFDFAVMEREAARSGMSWAKPRALCVRMLAALLDPPLPDQSLDTLCAWLGVAVSGRHRAAGDAEAAAKLFVALLPRLRERGIRTLAEAERACLGLTEHLETAYRAGWSEPISAPGREARVLGAIDPYAYRHRIADLMSAPPVIVEHDTRLSALVERMATSRISSLFVDHAAASGGMLSDYGIVTERDVMRRIAENGAAALGEHAGDIATRPLASIRAEAFVYRAIGRMDRLKIRHLAVRDDDGRLVGVVSARDLLRLRAGAAIRLDDAIEAATTAPEMAAAWSTLPTVAERLGAEGLEATVISEIVSEELRIATRRAAELAEIRMAADGNGGPPCDYAVLVLGSGGRGESLLAADQDNAIVFATGEPGGPEDRWFATMAGHMTAVLDAAGIPFCKGGVMASNPAWRGSLSTWETRIDDWVRRSSATDLLNVDIFFDLRAVHGRLELGDELAAHAFQRAAQTPQFAKLLGEQAESTPSPFGFLGRLATVDGRIDLKLHGLFPIVSATRTLAIRHGVRARSTRRRLEALKALDIGGAVDLDRLGKAHAFLTGLMLSQQSRDLQEGRPVSGKVAIDGLSADAHGRLKQTLSELKSLPTLVRDLMFS